LKECFAQAGRQLRPEGDELLKIGIDCTVFCVNCAGFCASFLVNCVFPGVFGKGSNPSPTALGVGVKMRRLARSRVLTHNSLPHQGVVLLSARGCHQVRLGAAPHFAPLVRLILRLLSRG
jgi:hypothetical protein